MTGPKSHRLTLRFLGIDPGAIVTIAIVAAALELVALFGLFTCPIDLGCPTGTNPVWITLSLFGIYVFLPVLGPISHAPFSTAIGLFLIFLVAYGEIFLLLALLFAGYRVTAKLILRLDTPVTQ